MTLFTKLALSFCSLLLMAIVGLSASFYWAEQKYSWLEAEQEQQTVLMNLVHMAEESFLTNDDLLLVKYTRLLQKWNPSLLSASVVDTQGDIIAHSEPDQIGRKLVPVPTALSDVLVISRPVRMGNQWTATASIAFSRHALEERVHKRLRRLQTKIAAFSLIALGMAGVFAFSLAHSWTHPIGRLVEATKQIGQGHWECHFPEFRNPSDELGHLALSFQIMAQQLKQLDTLKEDFVSAVTHELRSPLGAIESYLNLMQEEARTGIFPDIWNTYLERLRINTQRLNRFVNDLLDVAALERGKMDLHMEPLDLQPFIKDLLAFYAPTLQQQRIAAHMEIPEACPLVMVDPAKIRQVLTNLLSNAIKFTPENGTIHIQAMAAGNYVKVQIQDSGIGISESDQARIFDKFEQVRTARHQIKGPTGTGLGLAISQALITLHGGTLRVHSRPGVGSTFYFTLPVVTSASRETIQEGIHVITYSLCGR